MLCEQLEVVRLTAMDDAEKIAKEFIAKKKPGAEVSVTGAERTAKGWKIKGTTWEESKRSGGSTDWFVDIQGKDIVNYELKEGPGFAIG